MEGFRRRRAAYSSGEMLFPSRDLWISIGFYVFIALFFQLLRHLSRKYLKAKFTRVVVKEFLCAVEVTCSCFEFTTVIRHNGLWPFSVILFWLILWRKYSWQYPEDDVISYCPCNDITQVFKCKISLPLALTKNFVDILAAPVAYKILQTYWKLDLRPEHRSVMTSVNRKNCVSEIMVPLGPAMLTEAVGTLILCFVWAKMRAAKCIPVHISFAFATLITVMIANIAMPWTGAYFSPSLASAKMWGCKGSTMMEHLLTYWIAPIASELTFEAINDCATRANSKYQ